MAISGAHVIVYSTDAEVAVHPSEGATEHELYLMCDDLTETMAELAARGVAFDEITDARWGTLTRFRLPGGSAVGLYEPRHPRATEL